MPRKRYTVEQILSKLREAEVALAQGSSTAEVCRNIGVSGQTYYRWRKEYGGPSPWRASMADMAIDGSRQCCEKRDGV